MFQSPLPESGTAGRFAPRSESRISQKKVKHVILCNEFPVVSMSTASPGLGSNNSRSLAGPGSPPRVASSLTDCSSWKEPQPQPSQLRAPAISPLGAMVTLGCSDERRRNQGAWPTLGSMAGLSPQFDELSLQLCHVRRWVPLPPGLPLGLHPAPGCP